MDKRKQHYDLSEEAGIGFDSHYNIFQEVLDIVKPKNILETGFLRGGSAAVWLLNSDASLISVDPFLDTDTNRFLMKTNQSHLIGDIQPGIKAVELMKEKFPNRFGFVNKRSEQAFLDGDLNGKKFDLILLDGCHWRPSIDNDIRIALNLNIPYIILDDFWLQVEEAYNAVSQYFEIIKYFPKHQNFPKEGQPPLIFLKNINI